MGGDTGCDFVNEGAGVVVEKRGDFGAGKFCGISGLFDGAQLLVEERRELQFPFFVAERERPRTRRDVGVLMVDLDRLALCQRDGDVCPKKNFGHRHFAEQVGDDLPILHHRGIVVEIRQLAQVVEQAGDATQVVGASDVREDDLGAGPARAKRAELATVERVFEALRARDMQHHEQTALVGDSHRPVGQHLGNLSIGDIAGPRVIGIRFETEKTVPIEVRIHGFGGVALRIKQAQRKELLEICPAADVGIVARRFVFGIRKAETQRFGVTVGKSGLQVGGQLIVSVGRECHAGAIERSPGQKAVRRRDVNVRIKNLPGQKVIQLLVKDAQVVIALRGIVPGVHSHAMLQCSIFRKVAKAMSAAT